MKPVIKLLMHRQYGRNRLYPNCKLSHAICAIAHAKVLDEGDAEELELAGCQVDIKPVDKRPA